MGRGKGSLRLKVDLEGIDIGACTIIWDGDYQLHVVVETPSIKQETSPPLRAAVDLGQIHLAAVTTETGKSLVVSGRGIRSLKRRRSKAAGKIAKKQIRCAKGSRRWRKLQKAKRKLNARSKRRIRDLRHKATTQVINFCKQEKVTDLYIGNPEGVQRKNSGKIHNQRMSQWEFGKDISYLEHKSEKMGIVCSNGSERGTSSHCPQCDHRKKVKGRFWHCPKCDLKLHRDVVGSVNMFPLGFGVKIKIPNQITYLRPGKLRLSRCSSSLDTGQSSFAKLSKSSQQESCVAQATGPFRESYLQEAHPL
jgi:putative transposase